MFVPGLALMRFMYVSILILSERSIVTRATIFSAWCRCLFWDVACSMCNSLMGYVCVLWFIENVGYLMHSHVCNRNKREREATTLGYTPPLPRPPPRQKETDNTQVLGSKKTNKGSRDVHNVTHFHRESRFRIPFSHYNL